MCQWRAPINRRDSKWVSASNALEAEDGTSGKFRVAGLSAPKGPTLGTKEGEINAIEISGHRFKLTGADTSDTFCQDCIPTDITISGECEIDGRLHVAEIRFGAQNGEERTFTEGVECFDNDVPITEQSKNQGQCIKVAKGNPESGITEEDCKIAFQDKFSGLVK